MTHINQTRRAQTIALVLVGCIVVIELTLMIALSHARAPEGRFLAGERCTPESQVKAGPVTFLRKFEVSL